MKISILSRIIFLLTGHIAGYKIISGMDNYSNFTTALYTISFGLLLLSCLLLLLLDFEILENDYVAIISSLIPITLSLGLVSDKLDHSVAYSILISTSFFVAVILRLFSKGKVASLALGVIHLISGLVIFLIPIILFINGKADMQILLISVGGVIIGTGGLLLGSIKAGKPLLSKEKIVIIFPIILFFTTIAFFIGLK